MLNDGAVSPVTSSHTETIHFGYPLGGDDFMNDGGIEGRIATNKRGIDAYRGRDHEMNLTFERQPNKDQISAIGKLWMDYNCKILTVHSHRDDFLTPIDSSDRLEAVLQYGPEMATAPVDESVGLPDVQQRIKTRVKPSTDLTPSTWSGEEEWLKFLVLSDGSVIPVKSSHHETISGKCDHTDCKDSDNFSDSGGVMGIIASAGFMMRLYNSDFNDKQIRSIDILRAKYRVRYVWCKTWVDSIEIKSGDQLDAVLKYGPEMAQAPVDESNNGGTNECGFINTSGRRTTVDGNTDHATYAAEKLGKPKSEPASDLLREYGETSHDVRYYISPHGNVSVEFWVPITMAQFRTISKMVSGSHDRGAGLNLVWDSNVVGRSGSGMTFQSFRSFVIKKNLIE